MSGIYIPFNHNPNSVDVKSNTSNEAIPSGFYGRILPRLRGTGLNAIYLNDEIVYDEHGLVNNFLSINNASNQNVYTCPADGSAVVSIYAASSNGTVEILHNGELTNIKLADVSGEVFLPEVRLTSGGSIKFTASGTNGSISVQGVSENASKEPHPFWASPGSNIRVTSGSSYYLELYKISNQTS